jgi:hypothetical protein
MVAGHDGVACLLADAKVTAAKRNHGDVKMEWKNAGEAAGVFY